MSSVKSMLELLFCEQLRTAKLWEGSARELRFARPEREWRFDFAWPAQLVAVEIEGGTWIAGAHSRGKGFEEDCDKYNEAQLRGWRIFRFTTDQVEDGRAVAFMRRVFARETGERNVASG
jgi:very-short-patch-repair endonuclease